MPQRLLITWYNTNIQIGKRHRRYCERRWVRSGLSVHFGMFHVAGLNVRNNLATGNGSPNWGYLSPVQPVIMIQYPLSLLKNVSISCCQLSPELWIYHWSGANFHLLWNLQELYLSFDVLEMEECVAEITEWMKTNGLKCNDEKTEVLGISIPLFTDRADSYQN